MSECPEGMLIQYHKNGGFSAVLNFVHLRYCTGLFRDPNSGSCLRNTKRSALLLHAAVCASAITRPYLRRNFC